MFLCAWAEVKNNIKKTLSRGGSNIKRNLTPLILLVFKITSRIPLKNDSFSSVSCLLINDAKIIFRVN